MNYGKDDTQINGCDEGNYSIIFTKCRDCDKNESCSSKKLEQLNSFISEEPPIVKKLASVSGITGQEAAAALKAALEKMKNL